MAWVNADAQDGTNSATEADRSPAFRSNSEQRVGFHSQGGANNDDYKEREKYLTAKYPKHTMGLIRKRLAVEDWIDDQLKRIYNLPEGSLDTYDANIDLDEILDIDDDPGRIKYIEEQLLNAPQSPLVIKKFTEELLKKARDL